MYGRGTQDDKGPLLAAYYALRAIKDSGIECNKKIRFIVGGNEESGSRCLEYYYKTYDYRCMGQYSGYYPHYFLNKDSVEKYVQNKINAKRGIPNEE